MSTIVSEQAVLGFGTDVDSKVNVTLYDPKSDLTAETVSTAMDTVVGIDVLQCIRKHFHAPVTITSAYRTAAHTADIMVKGITPGKVAAYADTLLPEKGGIGEYRNFVHIDVRKMKCRWNVR